MTNELEVQSRVPGLSCAPEARRAARQVYEPRLRSAIKSTRWTPGDELFDQQLRQSRRVMPHHAVLLHKIIERASQSQSLQTLQIRAHRFGSLQPVAVGHPGRNGMRSEEHTSELQS